MKESMNEGRDENDEIYVSIKEFTPRKNYEKAAPFPGQSTHKFRPTNAIKKNKLAVGRITFARECFFPFKKILLFIMEIFKYIQI